MPVSVTVNASEATRASASVELQLQGAVDCPMRVMGTEPGPLEVQHNS